MIDDREFARELIRRLNLICRDPDVMWTVAALVRNRIKCATSLLTHPTIQVEDFGGGDARVGMLGLLNGLCGVITRGHREGWGWISAVFTDDLANLLRFEETHQFASAPPSPERLPLPEDPAELAEHFRQRLWNLQQDVDYHARGPLVDEFVPQGQRARHYNCALKDIVAAVISHHRWHHEAEDVDYVRLLEEERDRLAAEVAELRAAAERKTAVPDKPPPPPKAPPPADVG